MDELLIAVLFAYPVYKVLAFALLMSRLLKDRTSFILIEKMFYSLALVVLPSVMLVLATVAFDSDWKGAKGLGWFGVIHERWAGATLLPIWFAGIASLQVGLLRPKWLYESRINFVMVATVAIICAWYTIATLFLNLAGREMQFVLALVPGVACVNLVLLLANIWRQRRLRGKVAIFSAGWAAGIIVSLYAKMLAARSLYDSLPDEPPDCFIVTAAARGHPGFVGSRYEPPAGRWENAQLRRMRAFERYLMRNFPAVHRTLRRVYNVIGPAVAGRIRSPIVADLTYLLLKPVELLAWAVLLLSCR